MTEEKIKIIADWLITTGYNETETGLYIIDFVTVADLYEEPVEEIINHKEKIANEINKNDLILCPTCTDINFTLFFSV